MDNKYRVEVEELHQFIEGWLTGSIEKTREQFARFEDALAADFVIVHPSGKWQERSAVCAEFWKAHGVRSSSFAIDIQKLKLRVTAPPYCLVMYEEWQRDVEVSGRLSSALFREAADGESAGFTYMKHGYGRKSLKVQRPNRSPKLTAIPPPVEWTKERFT